ncbi:hypothetical protein GGS23DRAFT_544766 [Durotheca rogersii]|uniref:uncharacterized protein n=1 Tax=Durotheca rogersii TaxID=419775 RepID=UPI00221F4B2E|nr:uncharacterized protein GGS23DRAFT_544766 [Durotheca rogersii]KAI5868284.1 hypothetical protein GGS23DRAFT_544766 [Durotheca rogersii]
MFFKNESPLHLLVTFCLLVRQTPPIPSPLSPAGYQDSSVHVFSPGGPICPTYLVDRQICTCWQGFRRDALDQPGPSYPSSGLASSLRPGRLYPFSSGGCFASRAYHHAPLYLWMHVCM